MQLKIGIIGYNALARQIYLPALQFNGRAAVTAVTVSEGSAAVCTAAGLAAGTVLYDSCDALLKRSGVDAVMIAESGAAGMDILDVVLEAETAVFYEPSLCCSRQFSGLSDRLLAAGQVTWANLELDLHPAVSRARELIRTGRIGRLQSMVVSLPAVPDAAENILHSDNSLLCRYMAVCSRIAGHMPERVLTLDRFPGIVGYYEYQEGSQTLRRLSCAGSMGDRQENALIQDYHGVWGIFRIAGRPSHATDCSPFPRLILNGTQGRLLMDFPTGLISCQSTQKEESAVETSPSLRPYAGLPGARESVSAFLDRLGCAKGKDAGTGNAEKAVLLHRVSLAARESGLSGDWVQVRKLSP